MEPIFENSEQAVYLYFESDFFACNQKFAEMLGYTTADELMKLNKTFLQTFVAERSQTILADTYQKTLDKLVGSEIEVVWKNINGDEINTVVIMVPIIYGEHAMALHFIAKK